MPVLPTSERGASAGRRFSADELPDDWEAHAPRHSASSPASLHDSPAEPTEPPIAQLDVAPDSTAAAVRPAPSERPFHVRWFWPVVAIAVVAALVLAGTLIARFNKPAVPGGVGTPRSSLLSEPAELSALKPGTTWTATNDIAPDETKGLRCVQPSAQLKTPPLEGSVVRRTFTASSGEDAGVVQQVETYTDAEAAKAAFTARSIQLGGCPGTPDLVNKGFTVAGLGDQSVAVQVTEQDAAARVHQLLVVRTGSTLLITDAQAGTTPLGMDALAASLVGTLQRLCGPSSGTCPTTPTVADADVPPAGEFPGSLAAGDLPRVTPGTGVWVDAEIKPMKLGGSGCEGVDLTAVTSATSAVQHAYLLTGDQGASANFGLDEIVYTFANEADAKAFSDGVIASVTDCPKQQATATVTPLGRLEAPASGQLFTVDQRKTIDKAARSRVMVASLGVHAVYLAANPTPEFDLKDEAWLAVLQRAIIRAKQLP